MFVCCECCVLSGRGLCDGLITRPEESYRLWCVIVCDLETSWMRGLWRAVAPKERKEKKQDRHMWMLHNSEARWCDHCWSGKSNENYILRMCVCSFRYPACKSASAILPSVACLLPPYFSTWSQKRHDFLGGGGDKYKMSILIFSTNFVRKISHSKKNSARYNYTEWCKSMYKILL